MRRAANLVARSAQAGRSAWRNGSFSQAERHFASQSDEGIDKISQVYKSLGIKPPRPRRQSWDAAKLNEELYMLNSKSKPGGHSRVRAGSRKQSKAGTLPVSHSRMSHDSTNASPGANAGTHNQDDDEARQVDEQVERILEAGSKELFGTEEGREKLRDGSFNVDDTSKVMLQAASRVMEQNSASKQNQAGADDGQLHADARRAHEAAEHAEHGDDSNKVLNRVKEKVVGLGQTG